MEPQTVCWQREAPGVTGAQCILYTHGNNERVYCWVAHAHTRRTASTTFERDQLE